MRSFKFLPAVALVLFAAACGETPTDPDLSALEPGGVTEVVFTEGVPAPPIAANHPISFSTVDDATPDVGGSATTALSLNGAGCTEFPTRREVEITYSVSGRQTSPATFDVYTLWTFDGTEFVGSAPTTVNLPAKSTGVTVNHEVTVTVENTTGTGTGDATFEIAPFNVSTNESDSPGLQLKLGENSSATIHVSFSECSAPNTAPSITVPADITMEAVTSDGTVVDYSVGVSDMEDDAADLDLACSQDSGTLFPIGKTEVTCTVTDSGDLETEGSFNVYVHDTTAPQFTEFPEDSTIIATDIDGAVLSLDDFTMTAKDWGTDGEDAGEISPPVTIACTIEGDDADGYQIALGETVTVSCRATDSADYKAPTYWGNTLQNTSAAKTFEVFVGLDLSTTCGFGSPLRNDAPYSTHKGNSTIPHKICPPAYDDGTLATDLADGLNLRLSWQGAAAAAEDEIQDNPAAGSTTWRYDEDDEHYIFNAKTSRTWSTGLWETTVSYAGIPLASTFFNLK